MLKRIEILILLTLLCQSAQAATIMQEVKSCRTAWDAAHAKDFQQAVKLADPKKCPLSNSFLTWKKLREDDNKSTFSEYLNFITSHPNWPWMPVIRLKAEQKLNTQVRNAEIISFFKGNPPKTAKGTLFYLEALPDLETKKKVARHSWHTLDFNEVEQKQFLKKYKKLLSTKDHKIRLENLSYAEKSKQALRMLPLMSKEDLPWAKAKVAFLKSSQHPRQILSSAKRHSRELAYDHIRWHKKRDKLEGAHLLKSVPKDQTKGENWWKLRLYLAREALYQKDPKLAYEVMADHPFSKGENYADAEWFCGWVALRFLDDASLALKHLLNYQKNASTPASRAKSEYWLGRAYEKTQNKAKALEHFKRAAKYKTTYYGALAKDHINDTRPLKTSIDKAIPKEAWLKFQNHEFVRIARLLDATGFSNDVTSFLYLLGKRSKTEQEQYMTLKVIRQVKEHHAIFTAKDIGYHTDEIFTWLYPRRLLDNRIHRQGVDYDLIHAIIRQESGFNPYAGSPAGATGMMQVMPGTAEDIAKTNKYTHHRKCLTENPDYNVLLGAHFIKEQLDRFNGNYVLAIAAYNAGPAPVLKWVKDMGPPGAGNFDHIDWVEMIPYSETRLYVKLVLANYYVYRSLGSKKNL